MSHTSGSSSRAETDTASACHHPPSARVQCPWQSLTLTAPLACVEMRAVDGTGMLAVRRVHTSRGPYLHAQVSPRWPGCVSASLDPDALPARLPGDHPAILCDLRQGTMSDFPGVLICCLRVAAARPSTNQRLAIVVADDAGQAQAAWMEALARAVGVDAKTFVDLDAALDWMHA